MHNQLPIHSFINIYRITTHQGHIQRHHSWLIYFRSRSQYVADILFDSAISSSKETNGKRRERIKRILQGCYYWSLTFPSCGRIGTRWMFQRLASGETLVVVVCGFFYFFFFSQITRVGQQQYLFFLSIRRYGYVMSFSPDTKGNKLALRRW